MPEPLRIGIIGAGAVAQIGHLPVLRKLKATVPVALCDNDLPKARALAARAGIPEVYEDIEELLEGTELDAVVICTPNHLHEAHVLAALSQGHHVLVERPLALSVSSVQRIVRASERHRRLVMVGMNHRYRSDVQIIRSFVQSGELGDIESVRGSWHLFRPGRAALGWRLRRNESGGGALLDLGEVILDLGLWLANDPAPVRVSASFERQGGERGVEQSGSAFVVCAAGQSIFLDVTWHHIGEGERFGVGIRGSRGTAGINPLNVWKELHGVPTDVAPTGSGGRENPFLASFRAEWAHFVASIQGEAKPPSLEDQVTLHRVLEAIYRSGDDRREVVL
jgi:predicted dehydrogenase